MAKLPKATFFIPFQTGTHVPHVRTRAKQSCSYCCQLFPGLRQEIRISQPQVYHFSIRVILSKRGRREEADARRLLWPPSLYQESRMTPLITGDNSRLTSTQRRHLRDLHNQSCIKTSLISLVFPMSIYFLTVCHPWKSKPFFITSLQSC